MEILEDQPNMDMIAVPIGGGGLIAGISVPANSLKLEIKVIGGESTGANRYYESIKANKPIKLDKVDTIADGTRTDQANESNFKIIKEYVDEIVVTNDESIKEAMRLIIREAKLVIEPSSAMVISAFMNKEMNVSKKDKACFVISGGNNDMEILCDILLENKKHKNIHYKILVSYFKKNNWSLNH